MDNFDDTDRTSDAPVASRASGTDEPTVWFTANKAAYLLSSGTSVPLDKEGLRAALPDLAREELLELLALLERSLNVVRRKLSDAKSHVGTSQARLDNLGRQRSRCTAQLMAVRDQLTVVNRQMKAGGESAAHHVKRTLENQLYRAFYQVATKHLSKAEHDAILTEVRNLMNSVEEVKDVIDG